MTRLVILRPQQSSGELLVTRRARLRERIAARCRAHFLDTQLARGVAPEAGATLAPRAHDLDKPCMRLVLARGVQRVVDEARSRRRPSRSRVPVCNAEVLAAADELAKRLRSPHLRPHPDGEAVARQWAGAPATGTQPHSRTSRSRQIGTRAKRPAQPQVTGTVEACQHRIAISHGERCFATEAAARTTEVLAPNQLALASRGGRPPVAPVSGQRAVAP